MSLTKGLYKNLLGDFLALKLFPGDPILDPPNFRGWGPRGGGACFFLIGGQDFSPIALDMLNRKTAG